MLKQQTYKLNPTLYFFQHEFIENAKPVTILQKMILEAKEIQEEQTLNMNGNDSVSILGETDSQYEWNWFRKYSRRNRLSI